MDKKNSSLRILLIEDSDTDYFIIQNALRDYERDARCTRAATMKAGETLLQKGDADIVLLDLGLPDTASPEDTYERIKKWAGKLPVVIMTSLQDHDLAKVMVHDGAADFLNKDAIAKTPQLVQNAIDFSLERHAAHKGLAEESKQKDAMLNCFMGGYSVSGR